MDDKKEVKKRVKKGGKNKTKKEKKSKKKSKKTVKESMPTQFVQTQGKGTAGVSMGQTQPFGGGGLSGVLSALGIQPKFNQLGGTTGFSVPPTAQPIRLQQVAPKMEEKTITQQIREISPEEDIRNETNMYKRLERAFRRQTKDEVRDHIYKYFGGEASTDLDYVIQDDILKYKTKKGMLEALARFDNIGFGNINIDDFINFDPNDFEEEEEPLSVATSNDFSTVNVEVVPSTTNSSVGGESPSELGSVGFEEEE